MSYFVRINKLCKKNEIPNSELKALKKRYFQDRLNPTLFELEKLFRKIQSHVAKVERRKAAPKASHKDRSPAVFAESLVTASFQAGRGGIPAAAPSTPASGDSTCPAVLTHRAHPLPSRYPGSPAVNDAGTVGDFGAEDGQSVA